MIKNVILINIIVCRGAIILTHEWFRKQLKYFLYEIYSKPPKRYYPTNKTDVYHFDDVWSLDILDLKNYGPENNRGFIFVLVIKDKFSKFGGTVPLKNKIAQSIGNFLENSLINSKRKPNLIESDRGNEFYNNFFSKFL